MMSTPGKSGGGGIGYWRDLRAEPCTASNNAPLPIAPRLQGGGRTNRCNAYHSFVHRTTEEPRKYQVGTPSRAEATSRPFLSDSAPCRSNTFEKHCPILRV